jgi:hypothetical protein
MLFSVNQASHLYVAKRVDASLSKVGDIYAYITDDKDNIYFKYRGEGGLLRSDLIPVYNMMYIKDVAAENLATPLKEATVTITNDPVAGQDYILRIKYSIGSIDNQYIKYGAVRAFSGYNKSKFYEEMYNSLVKNFKRDEEPAFEFFLIGTANNYTGIAIKEIEPKWVLGTYPQRPIEFEISVDTIEVDGVDVPWGEAKVANAVSRTGSTKISYPNSKKIADLEYFCMGERGDQYKNYGWPNVIPTKYMVEPTSAGYDVLNIHYAYTGSNESVQKSEKDLFIVADSVTASSVISDLASNISSLMSPDAE